MAEVVRALIKLIKLGVAYIISALYLFAHLLPAGMLLGAILIPRKANSKPILGIKIAPKNIPIQNEGHKKVQSRDNGSKNLYRGDLWPG
jgi:hypothetical protein